MSFMPPSWSRSSPWCRSRRPAGVGAWLACILLVVGACSSDTGDTDTADPPTTLGADGLVAQVASYDLAVGPPARIIVGVQAADLRLVVFGTVDFRFSFLGTKEAPVAAPSPGPPMTAAYLAIPGTPPSPEGTSIPKLVSGSEARGVYAASVGFDKPGFWQVEVTAQLEGASQRATGAFQVLDRHAVPALGDPGPRTQNLLMDAPADVPRAAIDSRAGSDGTQPIPDPELHSSTVASAIEAGRPVVVTVSTPVYCTSRFCGPITDMAQELSHRYGDRASFVHIEVWRDFQNTVINQSAAEWIFPDRSAGLNEPWIFVLGADGKVIARFDNVATQAELEPILQALPVLAPPA